MPSTKRCMVVAQQATLDSAGKTKTYIYGLLLSNFYSITLIRNPFIHYIHVIRELHVNPGFGRVLSRGTDKAATALGARHWRKMHVRQDEVRQHMS